MQRKTSCKTHKMHLCKHGTCVLCMGEYCPNCPKPSKQQVDLHKIHPLIPQMIRDGRIKMAITVLRPLKDKDLKARATAEIAIQGLWMDPIKADEHLKRLPRKLRDASRDRIIAIIELREGEDVDEEEWNYMLRNWDAGRVKKTARAVATGSKATGKAAKAVAKFLRDSGNKLATDGSWLFSVLPSPPGVGRTENPRLWRSDPPFYSCIADAGFA